MLRMFLASTAVVAFVGGAAVAQEMPSTTGLTPGAPLGVDPYTDRGIVVGEQTPFERRAAQMPVATWNFDPARIFGLTGTSTRLSPGVPTDPDPLTDNKRVVGLR